jgi:tyrosine-protein kinase
LELRQYFGLLRKWAWLLVLTTVIAAGSSYLYSRTIPPTYQASTTILVGQIQNNPTQFTDPYSAYYASQGGSLADAYALFATQPPVLQATAQAINWPGDWQSLYFKISAKSVAGSQLVQIDVTDGDPRQATAIANEITHQLLLQGPISQQQKQSEDQRAFINTQLAQLKLQIESNQKSLTNLSNQAGLETDPKKLADLNDRISALQTKINTWQTNYASLSATLNNGSNLFVSVLAPAREPTTPVSPNIAQNVLLAAIAGLILSGAAVLLLEYLDDTVKDADDVQRVLNLSTLGAIARITHVHGSGDSLITLKHPRSPIAEAYRVLRTNLRFSGIENPSGALLVTSAGPGEGKTTTAANLAVALAQGGKRVILLDADLRLPSIHKLFGLPNEVGLSSMFLEDGTDVENVLQPTLVEGLNVITSGPVPPNPAEVLDSKQMSKILTDLRARVDMLILDSPPALAVADASILGSRCSGTIIVVDAGRTRTDVSRRAVETLQKTNVKILGVVLNKMNAHRAGESGYYYYYDRATSKDRTLRTNGHESN